MSHLESLIAEYLEWRGFVVRRSTKVGRRARGGWEMELDVVGFDPKNKELVHYEPSLDAHSWEVRTKRFQKKFEAGRNYIRSDLFGWLDETTPLRQVAVFINHPKGRDEIAGGTIQSVDELVAEIRGAVQKRKVMARDAISEQYPLLRTIQIACVGYYRLVQSE